MHSGMLRARQHGTAKLVSQDRTTVCEGEYMVSDRPDVTLMAVLGSCIAACLYDPDAGIGGMNHFLLASPGNLRTAEDVSMHRYGVHAMEKLMNVLIARGATRQSLRAHLYGGANMHQGMRPIGDENAAFARRFLETEGITLVREDTGGRFARRVEFRPAMGLVRSRCVSDAVQPPPAATPSLQILDREAGEVVLF